MSEQITRTIEFGSFRMDFVNRQLWSENTLIKMRPKTWAVLNYLVEHPGRLILKDELLNSVWGHTHVTTTALRVCIREIRISLGESTENPRFIETQGQTGYRFIAPIKNQSALYLSDTKLELIVGRADEEAAIEALIDVALSGTRQCIFVAGEAGAGKTTLLQTIIKRAHGKAEFWLGLGQCVEQFSEGEPYRPILEALGRLCRSMYGDEFLDLLRQHAPSWLIQMPTLMSVAELEMLKLQADDGSPERMLRELTEAVDAITSIRPLILVIEDLHWSDDSTLELISALSRRHEPAALVILGSYRSFDTLSYAQTLQTTVQELALHEHCIEVPLKPLPDSDVKEYLARRFPRLESVSPLADVVYKKSSGNPLFMVSTTDVFIAQGLIGDADTVVELDNFQLEKVASAVPDTLQKTIEVQIKQLAKTEQSLLRMASVSGNSFTSAIVAAGSGTSTALLEEQFEELTLNCPFIKSNGFVEWPDGTVTSRYRFTHALYRDVAYQQVAAARRIKLHHAIGERLELAYINNSDEIASELAIHFLEGRQYEKAIHYLHQAGINSHKLNAPREAINYLLQALQLLDAQPESKRRDSQELGLLLSYGPLLMATKGNAVTEVKTTYQRAKKLCENKPNSPQAFQAIEGLWQYHLTSAELDQTYELAQILLTISKRLGDSHLTLVAHSAMASTLMPMGRANDALYHARKGASIYRIEEHRSLGLEFSEHHGILCNCIESTALTVLGYYDQARQKCEQLLIMTDELNHVFSSVYALGYINVVHHFNHDLTALRTQTNKMIELSEEHSFSFWLAAGHLLRGWALSQQGEPEAGLAEIRQALSASADTEAGIYKSYYLGIYAEACRFIDTEEGLNAIELAFEHVSATGEKSYESELYRLKGDLLQNQASSSPSNLKLIEDNFQKARALAKERKLMLYYLRATISLAKLWLHQDKPNDALEVLTDAHSWFVEGFDQADVKEASQLIHKLQNA